jgi:hypothetical protein
MTNQITIAGTTYSGELGEDSVSSRLMPASVRVVEIDSVLAAALKMEITLPMPGQRKLDQKTVAEYCRLMNCGLWHLSTVYVVEVVDENGVPEKREDTDEPLVYLVNGNHTLQAVIDSGVSIKALFGTFRATRDEMRCLFSQVDNHKPRRQVTAMEPVALTFGRRPGRGKDKWNNVVSARALDMIVSAVHWASSDGMCPRPRPPKRDLALAHASASRKFIQWLISINNDPTRPFSKDVLGDSESYLWRLPVVAMMWKAWTRSESLATNFWRQLTIPSSVGSTQPARVLRDVLMLNTKNSSWGKLPHLRIAKACAMAMSAFSKGQELSMTIEDLLALSDEAISSTPVFDEDEIGVVPEVGEKSVVKRSLSDHKPASDKHHITVEKE